MLTFALLLFSPPLGSVSFILVHYPQIPVHHSQETENETRRRNNSSSVARLAVALLSTGTPLNLNPGTAEANQPPALGTVLICKADLPKDKP